jgi:hypothetical protein
MEVFLAVVVDNKRPVLFIANLVNFLAAVAALLSKHFSLGEDCFKAGR